MTPKSSLVSIVLWALPLGGWAQDTTYVNPVDGKTYVAPLGWTTYKPEGVAAPRQGKVWLKGVRLLQGEDEMAARSTPEDLAAFIDLARQAAASSFATYDKPGIVMVQFTCVPDRCTPQIASKGDLPPALLQAYQERLVKLAPAHVSGEIRFLITLDLNNGPGSAAADGSTDPSHG